MASIHLAILYACPPDQPPPWALFAIPFSNCAGTGILFSPDFRLRTMHSIPVDLFESISQFDLIRLGSVPGSAWVNIPWRLLGSLSPPKPKPISSHHWAVDMMTILLEECSMEVDEISFDRVKTLFMRTKEEGPAESLDWDENWSWDEFLMQSMA